MLFRSTYQFTGLSVHIERILFPFIAIIILPYRQKSIIYLTACYADIFSQFADAGITGIAVMQLSLIHILEQIVKKIPAPKGAPTNPLQALIFDSVYDSYKGVIIFCRVMELSLIHI